jgi:hypothetical protein
VSESAQQLTRFHMVTHTRYEDYTGKDVHDIFAPDSPFRVSAGTWGMHGITRC